MREYKRLSNVICHGDLYRLASPYEGHRAVAQFVNPTQIEAVVFDYNLHLRTGEEFARVRLQDLAPARRYRVQEINLMPGQKSNLSENNQTYSGDFLMKVGLLVSGPNPAALTSKVLKLTRSKNHLSLHLTPGRAIILILSNPWP